jgi:CBS domain-containing protein
MRKLASLLVQQQPVTLPASATVLAAARAMREHGVGSVLVTGPDGRLAGIFTGRDAVTRVLAAARDAAGTTLAEVMTPDPAVLGPDRRTVAALQLLADGGFRHVPVVADGRIVGVVSRSHFQREDIDEREYEQALWEHL